MKKTLLAWLILLLYSSQPLSYEISTFYPQTNRHFEPAYEFVNSVSDFREWSSLSMYRVLKRPSRNRLYRHIAYYTSHIPNIFLGIGSVVTIHEIGHAQAMNAIGGTDIYFGVNDKHNLSFYELLYYSMFSSSGFTSGIIPNSTYNNALVYGAGMNVEMEFMLRQHIKALKKGGYNPTSAYNIILPSLMHNSYASSNSLTSDYYRYVNVMNSQNVTVSRKNIQNQLFWTTFLSGRLFYSGNAGGNPGNPNKITKIKSLPITNKLEVYWPDFYTYMMPEGVTLLSEVYLNHTHIGLFSLGYETETYANVPMKEYTLGWYPQNDRVDTYFRLSLSKRASPYLTSKVYYKLTQKMDMFMTYFIGDRRTNAHIRQNLISDSSVGIGVRYEIN